MALQIFPGEGGGGIYSSKFVVVRDKEGLYALYSHQPRNVN